MMSRFTPNLIPVLLSALMVAQPGVASARDVQAEREHWAQHARSSDAALAESVRGLQSLYAESQDPRVRADLIALLLRQGRQADALAVCRQCAPTQLSADELENLAKAARDQKQFALSAAYYGQLQQAAPQLKIGFLGAALTAVDAGQYSAAKQHIDIYRGRFGEDADIRQAANYLAQRSQSLTDQLLGLQSQLSAHPEREDLVLPLYRTAAQLRAYPQQQQLIERYPHLFNAQDRLWLQKDQAVSLLRSSTESGNVQNLQTAYDKLSQVVNEAPKGGDLYLAALRDRMAAAIALNNSKQALEDYRTLQPYGEQPEYVKAQYAQALMMSGSPRGAYHTYSELAQRQQTQSGSISPAMREHLVAAQADLGYYTHAQQELERWNPQRYTNDFTHTRRIENPYYDKQYFWNVRLEAWNGNLDRAIELMDAWLAEKPNDPWGVMLRGDLAQWNGRNDEALVWFRQAKEQLPPDNQAGIDSKIGMTLIDSGNWRAAAEMARSMDRQDPRYRGFWEHYDNARAAQLSISGQTSKTTSPADGTEWLQSATLYSPRSEGGHRAYVTQQSNYVPNHGDEMRTGRVGVGGEIHLHPLTLNVEAGHGTHLNDKPYARVGANYRANERLSLQAAAAVNSANTPVKAVNQNVYANEYTVGANYAHSADTRAGGGASVMTFDDDNVRQNYYAWLSHSFWQHNRWRLAGSAWADHTRNRDIPEAHYYNPRHSSTVSGSLNLSYGMPLAYRVHLTQQLTGGLGRFWQSGEAAQNTWLLKYGHDWRVGNKLGVGYEFGRKQAIYDGKPEFQNFGNFNLNWKLQ